MVLPDFPLTSQWKNYLSQNSRLHLLVMSPLSPPIYDNSWLSFFKRPWHFWRVLANYVAEWPSVRVCLMFSHEAIPSFYRNTTKVTCPSQSLNSGVTLCWRLFIGKGNLDHSVKVVSARFLLYEATVFPFVKISWERYFETMQIHYFSSNVCPLFWHSLVNLACNN